MDSLVMSASHMPTCLNWVSHSKKDKKNIENKTYKQRLQTNVTTENINHVEKLILEDRFGHTRHQHWKCRGNPLQLARILQISPRWAPKLLNLEQKLTRWEICTRLLQHYDAEGEGFSQRIFTTDETWVHYYTPESKHASKEWRKKDEGAPMKAKVTPYTGKVMGTLFWNTQGVIAIDFLREQRTINAAYYSALLRDTVKPAYHSKCGDIPIHSALFLWDNSWLHVAQLTHDVLFELGWVTLEHPPYSPDVSPCDYYVFGLLKKAPGSQSFSSNDGVEDFVRKWFLGHSCSFYAAGIAKLPECRKKCVACEGNYLKKV